LLIPLPAIASPYQPAVIPSSILLFKYDHPILGLLHPRRVQNGVEHHFIRMITRIMKMVIANGLPIAEGKSEVWIHPIITWD
jgi:hypothetical protein